MKRLNSIMLMFILVLSLSVPTASAASIGGIEPYAFDVITGEMAVPVKVPQYVSPYGYTVDPWTFNMKIKYQITYNVNTGVITSVEYLGEEMQGGAFSPDSRGRVSSLNYARCNLSIANNGYSIKCTYSATATLIYTQYPGVPAIQETVRESVSGEATISPDRP